MPLVIDTYNVLHQTGVLPPEMAGIEIDGLIELIQQSRYRVERVVLACDGKSQSPDVSTRWDNQNTLSVRFAGAGCTADDLIRDLIKASSAPRRLIVVSSDHEIAREARKRRCVSLTSAEFLQQLVADATGNRSPAAQPAKPPGCVSQQQVDRWIDIFQLDERTLGLTSAAQMQFGEAGEDDDASEAERGLEQEQAESGEATAPAQAMAEEDEQPSPSLLPPNIIEQAERLWRRGERKASADETDLE